MQKFTLAFARPQILSSPKYPRPEKGKGKVKRNLQRVDANRRRRNPCR